MILRRIIILAVTAMCALAVVIAAPAGAKGKPAPEPTATYTVALHLGDDAEGLGSCGDDTLTMAAIDGAIIADGHPVPDGGTITSIPIMHLRADVPWSRSSPAPGAAGDAFDECHGGALAGSSSDIPSYFLIHEDRDGNMASMLWAFDVYTQDATKGRDKTPAIKEYFRLWPSDGVAFVDADGNACPIEPVVEVTCHVSGPFEIWHYYPIEQIGVADFAFSVTITRN